MSQPHASDRPAPFSQDAFGEEHVVRLSRFPKEFEQRFLDRIDRRFSAILLLSLFFHICLSVYFAMNPPSSEVSQAEIEQIQKRFASLVLERTEPVETQQFADVNMESQQAVGKDAGKKADAETKREKAAARKTERRGATAEARQQGRETVAAARRRTREQIKREVSSQGILGLLTSTSQSASGSEVEDVLGRAKVGQDLDKALSDVSGLRTANAGETGSGRGRDVRASRETGSGGIDDLVEGLGKSKATGVSRSGELMVDGATSLLEEETEQAFRGGRNIDDVSAVVKGHNSAIQYCYQRALKRNPGLRGKVVVRFTISPAGSVSHVEIVSSTLRNSRVESCIINRIKRWNDFGAVDPSLGDTTFRQVYTFGY